MEKNRENRFESLEPPREDKYDYCDFRAIGNPEGVLIAKQIQAQSYVNMNFVQPEGLTTLPGGEQILAEDIANPVDAIEKMPWQNWIEYSLGVKKNSDDLNPMTGELVAWKKRFAPLAALPTYIYCKDHLWAAQNNYLNEIDRNPYLQLAEPEALGKTVNAGRGVVIEFMRNEIQRVFGKNEVWFMGLVETTVFKTFVSNWGPLAVEQVGDPKQLEHRHVNPDVKLVPTVMNIDTFYQNFYYHLQALEARGELRQEHLDHFDFMSSGISDVRLGRQLAKFRAKIREAKNNES